MVFRTWYRYASVAAVCIVAAGCGDATRATRQDVSPLERVEAQTADARGSRGALIRRTDKVEAGLSASATITPEGGWLAIPRSGLLVYFPAGAVDHDLVVTASVLDGRRVAYDFQPHGTVFNTPIYVAQLLLGTELASRTDRNRPDVYAGYLANGESDVQTDGSASFAEVFEASYYGKGQGALVLFNTTHFSGYAMASGRRVVPDTDLQ